MLQKYFVFGFDSCQPRINKPPSTAPTPEGPEDIQQILK